MTFSNDTTNNTTIISSWVASYTSELYNWAFFKTSHKEVAEDLVQDTFLTAHQQLEKFRQESSPKTWLFGILNNKIKTYYRKKHKETAGSEDNKAVDNSIFSQLFDENDRWAVKAKPQDWHFHEEHLLDNTEFNTVLSGCLAKLPEHWRTAVNLKYIEQKKGEHICQELDIAPTNFWQILHRAKLQLIKCLELNWFKL